MSRKGQRNKDWKKLRKREGSGIPSEWWFKIELIGRFKVEVK